MVLATDERGSKKAARAATHQPSNRLYSIVRRGIKVPEIAVLPGYAPAILLRSQFKSSSASVSHRRRTDLRRVVATHCLRAMTASIPCRSVDIVRRIEDQIAIGSGAVRHPAKGVNGRERPVAKRIARWGKPGQSKNCSTGKAVATVIKLRRPSRTIEVPVLAEGHHRWVGALLKFGVLRGFVKTGMTLPYSSAPRSPRSAGTVCTPTIRPRSCMVAFRDEPS